MHTANGFSFHYRLPCSALNLALSVWSPHKQRIKKIIKTSASSLPLLSERKKEQDSLPDFVPISGGYRCSFSVFSWLIN